MAKRVKTRAIKVNRQYTYEKAADAVGVSCATVRRWKVDEGLEVLVSQKPHLIVGAVLKEFLDKKNAISGPKMRPGHFLCMTCGGHRGAYGKMADYWPRSDKVGMLKTLCEACEGPCNKLASKASLAGLAGILTIVLHDAGET